MYIKSNVGLSQSEMANGIRSGVQLFLNPEPKLTVPGIVFLQPSAHSPWEKCVVCRQVVEEVGSGQFAIHRMRDGGGKKRQGGKREYDMERCGRDKAGGEENWRELQLQETEQHQDMQREASVTAVTGVRNIWDSALMICLADCPELPHWCTNTVTSYRWVWEVSLQTK